MNFTVLATSEKLCCQTAADDRSREESDKSAAQLHLIQEVTSTAAESHRAAERRRVRRRKVVQNKTTGSS